MKIKGFTGDFKTEYPLHSEVVNIINKEAGLEANTLFFSKFSTGAELFSKAILYNKKEFKNENLEAFAFSYAHELGHIKNRASKSSVMRKLLSTTSRIPLSVALISIAYSLPHGTFEILDSAAKIILAGVVSEIPKAFRNSYVSDNEHEQDLFAYNITGVLPSKAIKLEKDFSMKDEENLSAISGYPKISERDEEVVKHGSPKPSPRLIELLKIDAHNRNGPAKH